MGDGPNLFAELGELALDHPIEPFVLGGGHRLWIGPEVPEVTYWPDRGAVRIEDGDQLVITGPPGGPVDKSVSVGSSGDRLVVRHMVRNATEQVMATAPWAITQLPPGGVAVLPTGRPSNGFQADRSLVLWPYTDPADPGLSFVGTTALVSGTRRTPLKVGSPRDEPALAYLRDGWAFVKVAAGGRATTVDFGATGQVYVDQNFAELETLGPLVGLEPGETTEHVEQWMVFATDETAVELSERIDDFGWQP